jgi:hypothetical protein
MNNVNFEHETESMPTGVVAVDSKERTSGDAAALVHSQMDADNLNDYIDLEDAESDHTMSYAEMEEYFGDAWASDADIEMLGRELGCAKERILQWNTITAKRSRYPETVRHSSAKSTLRCTGLPSTAVLVQLAIIQVSRHQPSCRPRNGWLASQHHRKQQKCSISF